MRCLLHSKTSKFVAWESCGNLTGNLFHVWQGARCVRESVPKTWFCLWCRFCRWLPQKKVPVSRVRLPDHTELGDFTWDGSDDVEVCYFCLLLFFLSISSAKIYVLVIVVFFAFVSPGLVSCERHRSLRLVACITSRTSKCRGEDSGPQLSLLSCLSVLSSSIYQFGTVTGFSRALSSLR